MLDNLGNKAIEDPMKLTEVNGTKLDNSLNSNMRMPNNNIIAN